MVQVKKEDMRDRLALERTRMAGERTDLAYIRTGMSLALAGLFFVGYFGSGSVLGYIGYFTVIIAVIFTTYGFYHHRKSTEFFRKLLHTAQRNSALMLSLKDRVSEEKNGECSKEGPKVRKKKK